ncbi:membrane fusion protein, multidrug efflux system [Solimonas aquatica]|uniref:Membrane fusion protein, multidrug efflux system n=1 Tax=Solimonas aquatica TaxID=489703 RepID=A0A1H9I5E3_9GAMM|nr:efflux RND transporter periplasmic adaptor subunit [Solimonas aquatica]SEQ69804.1 membrane fusion protein, multidrug efflux system [Solimonas aquatica]
MNLAVPRVSRRRRALVLLLLLALAWFAWRHWHASSPGAGHAPEATAVSLTRVRSGSAPVVLEVMGSVLSPHSVSVRAQISGLLKAVYFEEGQDVKAGERLFLIDPAPYQAALAQARAQLAMDRAAASSAQAQYERMKPLAEQDFVTRQEFDDARAAAQEAQARLQADQAAVQSAEINLGYTLIRAPISGRSGAIAVRSGNLVSSTDSTPLVVINQVERLQVQAAIPQDQLAAVQQALQRSVVPVRVSASRGGETLASGRLMFVDNAVAAGSGTVMLKAEVDNQAQALWPGAFVNLSLSLRVDPSVLLVPEAAVQPGAEGQYVFVVGADHKAVQRYVGVDRQAGAELVISKGLQAGETIIAKVPHNFRPGTLVRDAAGSRKAGAAQ